MNEQSKEKIRRKKIFNKKLKTAGLLFLASFVATLIFGFVPEMLLDLGCYEPVARFVAGLSSFSAGVLGIASVLVFAKTLHDPLTEAEAEELAEKDTLEKTGRN